MGVRRGPGERIATYIENNPRKAGLAEQAEDYVVERKPANVSTRLSRRQAGMAAPQTGAVGRGIRGPPAWRQVVRLPAI